MIGPHVRIAAGTKIGPHCVIEGRTTIGRDNTFYQFGSIGAMPQDMSHKGELTELRIGDRNTIREFCTLNTGTHKEEGVTRVGSDNWIMAYVHVAHDVRLGDRTVLANGVTLAGHVHVGDWAVIGGLSGVHQFVHIGAHAMIGFQAHVAPGRAAVHGGRGQSDGAARRQPHRPEAARLQRRTHRRRSATCTRRCTARARRWSWPRPRSRPCAATTRGVNGDIDTMLDFIASGTRGLVR